jgi:phage-related protein
MSYLLSGLNIQNIAEYDDTQSYEKYDVVDYQLNTGVSVYPSYTGFANNILSFWFDNDLFEDFEIDSSSNVTGWKNKAGVNFLTQQDLTKSPYIDFNYNFLNLVDDQSLTGDMGTGQKKTIFICFNAPADASYDSIKILQIGSGVNDPSGILMVSGQDLFGSSKIYVDDAWHSPASPIYDTPNIITLVSDLNIGDASGPYIRVRQNGREIGSFYDVYSGWFSGILTLGNNDPESSKAVKYHDIFAFNTGLDEASLGYYEKYLFEKYFFLQQGLYFAKQNVPVGDAYSPLTYTGINYWTKNIDDLFTLSYGSSVNFSSKLHSINFGDGYRSNIISTVNSLNASFNLNYDGLTDKQAKCLISYFENTPEAPNKSLYEGYEGVRMDLFSPYKNNAEIYFLDIDHSTTYNDINKITIQGKSLYESILNYKGMFVELDEINIRTYSNELTNFSLHDVVYFGDSPSSYINGYYFYTGDDNAGALSLENNPTGANSFFTKDFYFKQDVDYSFQSKLRVKNQQYRNGAEQISKDGINYNVLEFNVKLTKRSNKETRAILKFLDDRAGYKIFNYTLPQPYNKTIQVYCPEWNHTYEFLNNNTIDAKFIEFKGQSITNTYFNTKLKFVESII